MGAKGMLVAMVVGTPLVMALGHRKSEPAKKPEPHKVAEKPWLSKEAAAQIVGMNGEPGPLFDQTPLGGPAPSADLRERIVAFARVNDVKIDLDVEDNTLTGIRFAVTYPGGFGYEGAEVLAARLMQPSTGSCCVCGEEKWINDWTVTTGRTDAHVQLHVNTLKVQWRSTISLSELLDRADAALGQDVRKLARAYGEDWSEGYANRIHEPYLFSPSEGPFIGYGEQERGLAVYADASKVTEVTLEIPEPLNPPYTERPDVETNRDALVEHWGRPQKTKDTWTWRLRDRKIVADVSGDYGTDIVITPR